MQQITRVEPDDGCAEKFIGAFCGQYLDETGILTLDHRAIEIFQWHDEQIVGDIFLFRLFFAEADAPDLWICVSAPRHDRINYFLPQKLEWNKNVPHDNACLRVGHVCEQEWPDNITCGVNMPLRRLQITVNAQSALIGVNSCRL